MEFEKTIYKSISIIKLYVYIYRLIEIFELTYLLMITNDNTLNKDTYLTNDNSLTKDTYLTNDNY